MFQNSVAGDLTWFANLVPFSSFFIYFLHKWVLVSLFWQVKFLPYTSPFKIIPNLGLP